MTNKKLDRKFMSWLWGIIRLFPFLLFLGAFVSILLQLKETGFLLDEYGQIITFSYFILDGPLDSYFDYIIELLPRFLQDFYLDLSNYFDYSLSYFNNMVFVFILYQIWISILQLLFNVIMILPNITNYFIEKFNHLGNKGDY